MAWKVERLAGGAPCRPFRVRGLEPACLEPLVGHAGGDPACWCEQIPPSSDVALWGPHWIRRRPFGHVSTPEDPPHQADERYGLPWFVSLLPSCLQYHGTVSYRCGDMLGARGGSDRMCETVFELVSATIAHGATLLTLVGRGLCVERGRRRGFPRLAPLGSLGQPVLRLTSSASI